MPGRVIVTTESAAPSSTTGPAWWMFSTLVSAIGGLSFNEICGAIAAVISIAGGVYAWKANRARVKYEAAKDAREAEEHELKMIILRKKADL